MGIISGENIASYGSQFQPSGMDLNMNRLQIGEGGTSQSGPVKSVDRETAAAIRGSQHQSGDGIKRNQGAVQLRSSGGEKDPSYDSIGGAKILNQGGRQMSGGGETSSICGGAQLPNQPVRSSAVQQVQFIAKYGYTANPESPLGRDAELTTEIGDIVIKIKPHPHQPLWLLVENDTGKSGYVPESYLMVISFYKFCCHVVFLFYISFI